MKYLELDARIAVSDRKYIMTYVLVIVFNVTILA
jgi:hypothetical protein